MTNYFQPHIPRATRVAVNLLLLYRRTSERDWLAARIVNLSESGALFAPSDLQPGTPVEVILWPREPVAGFASGKQVCEAEVVRVTEAGAAAVRFEECRFVLEV